MFPIRDTLRSRSLPGVTIGIILVTVAVFFFELTLSERRLEGLFYLFGVVPWRYTHPTMAAVSGLPPHDFRPFVTGIFLHGGWLHIITNMWMLWIFGDNVEDRMGHIRFFLFYILCGILSGFVHLLSNPSSTIPTIGASGAIAGVLGAYFLLFPFARIVTLIPVFFLPLFVEIHAVVYLLFWFLTQFYSGSLSLLAPSQGGGIAWWAHIGGFLAGMFLCRYFLKKPYRR